MTGIKQYLITYLSCNFTGHFDMAIEVDHSVVTAEKLAQLVELHRTQDDGPAESMAPVEGSPLETVLKLLVGTAANQSKTLDGMLEAFSCAAPNGGQAGWPPMDGSEGFRIVSATYIEATSGTYDFLANVSADAIAQRMASMMDDPQTGPLP